MVLREIIAQATCQCKRGRLAQPPLPKPRLRALDHHVACAGHACHLPHGRHDLPQRCIGMRVGADLTLVMKRHRRARVPAQTCGPNITTPIRPRPRERTEGHLAPHAPLWEAARRREPRAMLPNKQRHENVWAEVEPHVREQLDIAHPHARLTSNRRVRGGDRQRALRHPGNRPGAANAHGCDRSTLPQQQRHCGHAGELRHHDTHCTDRRQQRHEYDWAVASCRDR